MGTCTVAPVPPERPEIDPPEGDVPFELGIDDLTLGDGDEATAGKKVTVHYVGVSFLTGEEFDASWNRGQPFEFKLGKGQVIPGWDQGVAGMKVGGRRRLTIPVGDGVRRARRRRRDQAARAARLRGRPARGRLAPQAVPRSELRDHLRCDEVAPGLRVVNAVGRRICVSLPWTRRYWA